MVVRGIQDLGDDLGHGPLLHALDIVALGEEVHIQRVGALGVPQAQGVHLVAAITGDEHIPGYGDHRVISGVLGMIAAVVVPTGRDLAAEADLHRVFIAGDQPALRSGTPVVGYLGLSAVLKLLPENAQLIANGIAGGRQAQGSHAVHVAGRQSAQTAVAQTRIRLCLENVRSIPAQVLQSPGEGFGNAQVEGVFHQASAHEKFHGHIMDFLLRPAGILHRKKAAHDLPDHHGRGLEHLIVRSLGGCGRKMGAELVLNGRADLVAGNFTNHMG